MLKFQDVPFRKWHHGKLIDCKEGKKVFALGMKEMQAGKAVNMKQSQPLTRIQQVGGVNATGLHGQVYDTISLTVED